MAITPNIPRPGLDLEYPMSLGVYDKYEQAQKVVDYLSDNEFAVQNMVIVGTELRSVERVTGRLTRRKAAIASAVSGAWMGLFIGLAFALFGKGNQVGFVITVVIFGAIFGLAWSQIGFSAITRGGTRDFSSVTQVVATKYEVLVEHRLADRARELLIAMPGANSQTF
ncbi:general stress protein [Jatrophihabitans sp. DSM 45814]